MWVQDTQQNKKYTTRHMNKIWRNAFSLRVKPSSFFPSFPFRNWYTQPNQILSLPFCACTPVRGTWVSTCMLKRPETSITLNFSACVACQSPGLCMQHIYSFPLSSFFYTYRGSCHLLLGVFWPLEMTVLPTLPVAPCDGAEGWAGGQRSYCNPMDWLVYGHIPCTHMHTDGWSDFGNRWQG